MLEITVDMTGVEAMLSRAGDAILQPYDRLMKSMGQQAARSEKLTFQAGGRPDKWEPLKDNTVRQREERARRMGITLPAGVSTPLRFTDALFKAATATAPGVKGSEIEQDGWHWENTITLPYAGRQDALRPFMQFQTADEESFTDQLFGEVRNRLNRAQR